MHFSKNDLLKNILVLVIAFWGITFPSTEMKEITPCFELKGSENLLSDESLSLLKKTITKFHNQLIEKLGSACGAYKTMQVIIEKDSRPSIFGFSSKDEMHLNVLVINLLFSAAKGRKFDKSSVRHYERAILQLLAHEWAHTQLSTNNNVFNESFARFFHRLFVEAAGYRHIDEGFELHRVVSPVYWQIFFSIRTKLGEHRFWLFLRDLFTACGQDCDTSIFPDVLSHFTQDSSLLKQASLFEKSWFPEIGAVILEDRDSMRKYVYVDGFSPAVIFKEKAIRLQQGDIIFKLDGKKVETLSDVTLALGQFISNAPSWSESMQGQVMRWNAKSKSIQNVKIFVKRPAEKRLKQLRREKQLQVFSGHNFDILVDRELLPAIEADVKKLQKYFEFLLSVFGGTSFKSTIAIASIPESEMHNPIVTFRRPFPLKRELVAPQLPSFLQGKRILLVYYPSTEAREFWKTPMGKLLVAFAAEPFNANFVKNELGDALELTIHVYILAKALGHPFSDIWRSPDQFRKYIEASGIESAKAVEIAIQLYHLARIKETGFLLFTKSILSGCCVTENRMYMDEIHVARRIVNDFGDDGCHLLKIYSDRRQSCKNVE